MTVQTPTSTRERHPDRHDAALALAEGAQAVREQIGSSAREVSDTANQEAAKVSHIVRDWLGQQTEGVREQAVAVSKRTQRYVRDEPLKSVLVAAAAGALVTGLVVFAARRTR
jgi:ElaB/YqjD/DUF883 family membrane-anchored ribosome-binding protein